MLPAKLQPVDSSCTKEILFTFLPSDLESIRCRTQTQGIEANEVSRHGSSVPLTRSRSETRTLGMTSIQRIARLPQAHIQAIAKVSGDVRGSVIPRHVLLVTKPTRKQQRRVYRMWEFPCFENSITDRGPMEVFDMLDQFVLSVESPLDSRSLQALLVFE